MNDKENKQSLEDAEIAFEGRSSFESSDEFLEFAREYFSTEFPNPDMVGCPSREKLAAIARSNDLPDDTLRSHLFSCSACFNLYREVAGKAAHVGESLWRRVVVSVSGVRAAAYAAAVLLAFLSILGVFIWRNGMKATDSPPARPEASTVKEPSNTDTTSNRQPFISENRAPDQSATMKNKNAAAQIVRNFIRIDPESHAPSRAVGENNSEDRISLPRSLNSLLLVLPEGSNKGFYTVSIRDGFGKTILRGKKTFSNGKTLKTVLDIRQLSGESYYLCVSRQSDEDEVPHCYAIVVSARKAAPAHR
jgi:hypothetical protein